MPFKVLTKLSTLDAAGSLRKELQVHLHPSELEKALDPDSRFSKCIGESGSRYKGLYLVSTPETPGSTKNCIKTWFPGTFPNPRGEEVYMFMGRNYSIQKSTMPKKLKALASCCKETLDSGSPLFDPSVGI
ncbi:hypothetical protein M758_7G147400 [Ceratodon purpureus]|nr:hypothetical protein M758_7G147400 [Ceratodon purpureus]